MVTGQTIETLLTKPFKYIAKGLILTGALTFSSLYAQEPAPEAPPAITQSQEEPNAEPTDDALPVQESQKPDYEGRQDIPFRKTSPEDLSSRLTTLATELIRSQAQKKHARQYSVILGDVKETYFDFIKTQYPFIEEKDLQATYNSMIKNKFFADREESLYPTTNKVLLNELNELLADNLRLAKYFDRFPKELQSQLNREIELLESHKKRMVEKGHWVPSCPDDFKFSQKSADQLNEAINKVIIRAINYLPMDEYREPIELYRVDRNGFVKHHLNPAIRTFNPCKNDASQDDFRVQTILHFLQYRNQFAMDAWTTPESYKKYMDMHETLGSLMTHIFRHTQKHDDLRGYLAFSLQPEHYIPHGGVYVRGTGEPNYSFDTTRELAKGFTCLEEHTSNIYKDHKTIGAFITRSLLKQPVHVLDRAFKNTGRIVEDIGEGKIGRLVSKDIWHLMYNYFALCNYTNLLKGDIDALTNWILWGAGETSPPEAALALVQSLHDLYNEKNVKNKGSALLQAYFNANYLINAPNDLRYVVDQMR